MLDFHKLSFTFNIVLLNLSVLPPIYSTDLHLVVWNLERDWDGTGTGTGTLKQGRDLKSGHNLELGSSIVPSSSPVPVPPQSHTT